MKQIIYSLLIGCLVLAACKKNNATSKPGDKTTHKVLFHVGFSEQTAKFNTNAITHLKTNSLTLNSVDTALTNHISVLIYDVYNSTGTLVHEITQSVTDAGFGSYTDNLLPGNYTVCIAGGGPRLEVASLTNATSLNVAYLTYANGFNYGLYQYDTFFQKIALTVTDADQTQSIALNRLTNLLQVVIKDAIPANVKVLSFYVSGAANSYFYATQKTSRTENFEYTTYTVRDTIQVGDIGKTNFTVSKMLLYSAPLTVRIEASSTLDTVKEGDIAEKTITNVTCQPNAETILSGNLFGGLGTNAANGFSVIIDTTYNSTPIIKTFP